MGDLGRRFCVESDVFFVDFEVDADVFDGVGVGGQTLDLENR